MLHVVVEAREIEPVKDIILLHLAEVFIAF